MRASILSSVVAVSLVSGVSLHPSASWAATTQSGDPQTKGASPADPETEAAPPTAEPEASPSPEVAGGGAPRSGRVAVDADALGDGSGVLAGSAIKAANEALIAQGVRLTEATEAPAGPELRIRLTKPDPEGFDFVIEYEVLYAGKRVEGSDGAAHCDGCNDEALVEQVAKIAEMSSPLLVEPEDETDGGEGGGGEGGEGGGEGGDPDVDDPSKLGGKGKAGIALAVVGGLGIVAGVVMLVRKPSNIDDDPLMATQQMTTRPIGAGVLAGGVVAAAVGTVLIVLDRRAAKPSRESSKGEADAEARVRPYGLWGPGVAGLGVRGRF